MSNHLSKSRRRKRLRDGVKVMGGDLGVGDDKCIQLTQTLCAKDRSCTRQRAGIHQHGIAPLRQVDFDSTHGSTLDVCGAAMREKTNERAVSVAASVAFL